MGFKTRAAACLTVAFGVVAVAAGPAAAARERATVYTSTNAASGNAVLAFDRAGDGSLKPAGSFPTGGSGTGGGLSNEGALALSHDGRFLYVVNAGGDSVSEFAVHRGGLSLLGSVPSRGHQPISLTSHGDLLYVLNAGSGTIAGFTGARRGDLTPLLGSRRSISGAGPAEVRFSPDGGVLVVTDRDTNTIETFAVGANGRTGPAQSQPSAGEEPFGFDFDKLGHLIVSEAFGGAAGASAVSSYNVAPGGGLTAISPSVADHEAAACWIDVSRNGRYAYTSNTGSGSISSYVIRDDGSIRLLEQVAADTGGASAPADLAESHSGRVLLALLPGSQSVASYRVDAGGGLRLVDQVGGVGASATGLVAR